MPSVCKLSALKGTPGCLYPKEELVIGFEIYTIQHCVNINIDK